MCSAAVLMTHLFSHSASGDGVDVRSNNGRLVHPVISSVLLSFFNLFFLIHRAAQAITGLN